MAALSADALQAGQQLGMASYYYSINDADGGSAAVAEAADLLNNLSSIVVIEVSPGGIHNEADVINLRQSVGATLDRANKILHATYQLGLHMGLAIGESGAPPPAWPTASQLCKAGIQQAQADFRDPALYFLDSTSFTSTLSQISTAINPQQKSTEPWEDLTNVFNQINTSLGAAGPPAP